MPPRLAVRSACDRCRVQKLRCSQRPSADQQMVGQRSDQPCTRCERAGTKCVTGSARSLGRPRRTVSRNQESPANNAEAALETGSQTGAPTAGVPYSGLTVRSAASSVFGGPSERQSPGDRSLSTVLTAGTCTNSDSDIASSPIPESTWNVTSGSVLSPSPAAWNMSLQDAGPPSDASDIWGSIRHADDHLLSWSPADSLHQLQGQHGSLMLRPSALQHISTFTQAGLQTADHEIDTYATDIHDSVEQVRWIQANQPNAQSIWTSSEDCNESGRSSEILDASSALIQLASLHERITRQLVRDKAYHGGTSHETQESCSRQYRGKEHAWVTLEPHPNSAYER